MAYTGFAWKEDFETEEISKSIPPVSQLIRFNRNERDQRDDRDRRDRRNGIYLQKTLFC